MSSLSMILYTSPLSPEHAPPFRAQSRAAGESIPAHYRCARLQQQRRGDRQALRARPPATPPLEVQNCSSLCRILLTPPGTIPLFRSRVNAGRRAGRADAPSGKSSLIPPPLLPCRGEGACVRLIGMRFSPSPAQQAPGGRSGGKGARGEGVSVGALALSYQRCMKR